MRTDVERELKGVGDRLKILRTRNGFNTPEEFCLCYGLPHLQYARMEDGKGRIVLTSLVRVLKIHRMTLEEFFCFEANRAAA